MEEIKGNKEAGKKDNYRTLLAYVGGGIGVGFFAIFGLIYSSFLGGLLGLNLAGSLLGYPVEPTLLSRIIIAFGMLTGVLVAGLGCVVASSALGWLIGLAIDNVTTMKTDIHKPVKKEGLH